MAAVDVLTVADMLTVYADDAIDLGVDLLAIFLLAFLLYFRRHRRADLLLAYVALKHRHLRGDIGGARVIAQSFGASGYPPGGPPAQDESVGFNPKPPAAMAAIFAAIRRLEELVTAMPDGVVLRYGGFYGPGTALDRHSPQIEAVRRRLLPIVGDGGVAVRGRGPWGRAAAAPPRLAGPDRRRRGGRVPDDAGTWWIERAGQGRTGLEARVSGLARGVPGRVVGLTGPIAVT